MSLQEAIASCYHFYSCVSTPAATGWAGPEGWSSLPQSYWQIFGWICLREPWYSLSLGCVYVPAQHQGRVSARRERDGLFSGNPDTEWRKFCFFFLSSWLPDLALSLSQFWCTETVELISPAEKHVLFARLMNSASLESILWFARAGTR